MSVIYRQIPNMGPVLSLSGTEDLEVVQAGVSKRATIDQVSSLVVGRVLALPLQPTGAAGGDLTGSYPNPKIRPGLEGQFLVTAGGIATWQTSILGDTVTSDTPPTSPVDGDLWWDSTLGKLFVWYVDADSGQWVPATPSSGGGGSGGGGGGGGDDLDTTPVAATGSTLARTVPDWLAGPPVIVCPADILLAPEHRGAWLHMTNAIGAIVQLPDDWPVGMSVGVRQMSTGPITWSVTGSATVQLPFTRNTHVGISEQYEEMVLRVVANSDGGHAVWGVAGSTG